MPLVFNLLIHATVHYIDWYFLKTLSFHFGILPTSGVKCTELPLVGLNMKMHVESQYYGGEVTFECEEGYKLNMESANTTCQEDGQWSRLDNAPHCEGERV